MPLFQLYFILFLDISIVRFFFFWGNLSIWQQYPIKIINILI